MKFYIRRTLLALIFFLIFPDIAFPKNCTYRYADVGQTINGNYVGKCVDGMAHGFGRVKYDGGDLREGDFEKGLPSGYGKYISSQGWQYSGYFKAGLREGKGSIDHQDGRLYKGDWKQGKKWGSGEQTWISGDYYKGDWLDDLPHGQGRMVSANKSVYTGSWFKGKKHQSGELLYSNGDIYRGDWYHDKRQGYGEFTWKSGLRYEGDFKNDEIHGYGVLYYEDGSRYEGPFYRGLKHGVGVMIAYGGYLKKTFWNKDVEVFSLEAIQAQEEFLSYQHANNGNMLLDDFSDTPTNDMLVRSEGVFFDSDSCQALLDEIEAKRLSISNKRYKAERAQGAVEVLLEQVSELNEPTRMLGRDIAEEEKKLAQTSMVKSQSYLDKVGDYNLRVSKINSLKQQAKGHQKKYTTELKLSNDEASHLNNTVEMYNARCGA